MKSDKVLSIKVVLKSGKVETFEELVALYPVQGVEIVNPEDPMYDVERWVEEERPERPEGEAFAILYADDEVTRRVLSDLQDLIDSFETLETEEVDWMKKWAEGFRGIEAGETLFIHPPWVHPKEGKNNVVLLPGMAFGTGSHETTRLSAAALEKWLRPGDRVIDVGSGSGVLSLCAAALGAKDVLAIENDPMTFSNAEENFSMNPFGEVITHKEGDLLQGVNKSCDLIVANILPPILVRMAPQTLSVLSSGGIVILSGILQERVEEVKVSYREHFRLLEETVLNEWTALVWERKE